MVIQQYKKELKNSLKGKILGNPSVTFRHDPYRKSNKLTILVGHTGTKAHEKEHHITLTYRERRQDLVLQHTQVIITSTWSLADPTLYPYLAAYIESLKGDLTPIPTVT